MKRNWILSTKKSKKRKSQINQEWINYFNRFDDAFFMIFKYLVESASYGDIALATIIKKRN